MSTQKRIPDMPQGCKLLRFWPPREAPVYISGYPHKIDDPVAFIERMLARLDRKLRGDRSEPFTVEGLVHRLSLVGVIIEIDETAVRRRRRADP